MSSSSPLVKEIQQIFSSISDACEKDFNEILFQNLKNLAEKLFIDNPNILNAKDIKELAKEMVTKYVKNIRGTSVEPEIFKTMMLMIIAFSAKDHPDYKNLNAYNFVTRPPVYKVVCEGIPYEQTLVVFALIEHFTDIFKKNGVPIKKIVRYGLVPNEKQSSICLQLEDEIKPSLKVMEELREIIYTIFIVDSGEDSKHRNVTKECIDVLLV